MKSRLRSTRAFWFFRSERGGALAELAVILPVLILFAVGIMDYGRVFIRSIVVANAARAGAEWGAFSAANYSNQSGIQSFAKLDAQEISGLLVSSETVCKCGDTEVFCSVSCSGFPPRVYVKVVATDSVTLLLKYPGLPSKIAVRDSATFRGPQ